MPPRPNDRGRTSTPPQHAQQSSQSYEISSQGEDDDDFIGNDSYDGSPEGSWDSSGHCSGTNRQGKLNNEGGNSSRGESLEDDDFIALDSSSGAEEYEGEFDSQLQDKRQNSTSGEQQEEYHDFEVESDDTTQRIPTHIRETGEALPAEKMSLVCHASQPAPSHTSGSAGIQREDNHVDDLDDADSCSVDPSHRGAGIDVVNKHSPEETEYGVFEEYSDEDAAMPADGDRAHDEIDEGHSGSERQDSVDIRPSRRDDRQSFNAKAYMQSRLAMHLIVPGDSEEDEDATPRLPSLSSRAREREQEKLLIAAAGNSQDVSASDEVTPRLKGCYPVTEQEIVDAANGQEKVVAGFECPEMIEDAVLEDVAKSTTKYPEQCHGEATAMKQVDARHDSADRYHNLDTIETVVTHVVLQAISDAGGRVPQALVEELPTAQGGEFHKIKPEGVIDQARAQREKMAVGPLKVPSSEARTYSIASADREDLIHDEPAQVDAIAIGGGNANEESALERRILGASGLELSTQTEEKPSISLGQQHATSAVGEDSSEPDSLLPRAYEELQTVVTPSDYLSEKFEFQENSKNFKGYSVKLESDGSSSTCPSSRFGSRPSSMASSIGSNQPKASRMSKVQKTRIQMRNAQREVSYEISQGSQTGIQTSSNTMVVPSASQEDLLLGRPDWNSATVRSSRTHKDKYRYEPPPILPGSKWVRSDNVAHQRSLTSQSNTSLSDLKQTSRDQISWEESEVQPEDSKVSVTARGKEYWALHVQKQKRRKKSRREPDRPGSSISMLGSMIFDSEDHLAMSDMLQRPETAEGYASRFRYNVEGARGGSFSRGVRKDDVDLKIRDAATKPGAGYYNVGREDSTPLNGGKMLETFEAVGSAGWETRKQDGLPGPGQYGPNVNGPILVSGGRFSQQNRWKDTEIFERRSREKPGPLEYDAGEAHDKSHKRVNGGMISNAVVKSEVDWAVLRGSRTPGPATYTLPPVSTTKMRAKGGMYGRGPRARHSNTTSDNLPGPGSYFKETSEEVKHEISVRRTASRNSVVTSRSRASLRKELSHELATKSAGRRTYLDDVTSRASKFPGPASYQVDKHTVSNHVSREVLHRSVVISGAGSSDPVVYSIGQAQRSSIVSDYRTIRSLQRTWADSANNFKTLLASFISSTTTQPDLTVSSPHTKSPVTMLSPSPSRDDGYPDSVFLTQHL